MSFLERLREQGNAARPAPREEPKPQRKSVTQIAKQLPADLVTVAADVDAWRTYRSEPDAFKRMRFRQANNKAIERGRAMDEELPE